MTATDTTLAMRFRCDGCGAVWECVTNRKLDTETIFLAIARRHGWLKCATCSREPAARVA